MYLIPNRERLEDPCVDVLRWCSGTPASCSARLVASAAKTNGATQRMTPRPAACAADALEALDPGGGAPLARVVGLERGQAVDADVAQVAPGNRFDRLVQLDRVDVPQDQGRGALDGGPVNERARPDDRVRDPVQRVSGKAEARAAENGSFAIRATSLREKRCVLKPLARECPDRLRTGDAGQALLNRSGGQLLAPCAVHACRRGDHRFCLCATVNRPRPFHVRSEVVEPLPSFPVRVKQSISPEPIRPRQPHMARSSGGTRARGHCSK